MSDFSALYNNDLIYSYCYDNCLIGSDDDILESQINKNIIFVNIKGINRDYEIYYNTIEIEILDILQYIYSKINKND